MFAEFKKFAMRGNVIDLAVGVVIGAAFGAIVNSLVKDVIMPPIGYAMGGIDFSNFFITLKGPAAATLADAQKAGAVTINYGLFVNTVINFLVVAIALFVLIRAINRLQTKPPEAPPAAPPEDVELLREIRDLLKARA
ncbi:MAG TPA: large conductance mechanosensitive channel protein MscL [Rhizomicrobium sp.]|jgi:large conductance mechanosensitive channel|nr:large conductance mechanosensitive channel protein MscL [Rhizomicrobium sp.]